ncbi:threonine-phosphate decarboxylase CobD [Paracoccus laeviglucosivorans]|uniref:threonine-phosphate decarboxylase n=1 Tax=Paracoccus laeviglucosivorans TaxID=1197861 RepID=A0A521ACR8_9RHOB|nr:threonine-phosphate decarboxylase CobD [Paracoccus laeviglucosivorans]SMO32613.1 L-threonine O-3-phosphate decarboxylase [Paracoccus laeviglucosivorans]
MRDHGGDIDLAALGHGGTDWIDLSTGINRRPYNPAPLSPHAFQALPTQADQARLIAAASARYGASPEHILPLAGASAAIQLMPHVVAGQRATVLSPTYNEHAASLRAAGWQVDEVTDAESLGGDLAVIVNPNNPDGRSFAPTEIVQIAARVGHLVVDESFADPRPDLSVVALRPENVTVLRSFGKFWGLAGLRLGFAIGQPALLAHMAERAGPWSVSGPALEIGTQALSDDAWAEAAVTWLAEAALHLDQIAGAAGWQLTGGTHLFRLYDTPDAKAAQAQLARAGIWSRIFPWHPTWIRLGIPGNRAEFDRVQAALTAPG